MHQEFLEKLKATGLTSEQSEQFFRLLWETIARELAVGEEVDVPGLGTFYTIKKPAQHQADGKITLPSIEAQFDPEPSLSQKVTVAIGQHPELFKDGPPDQEENDDDDQPEVAKMELEKESEKESVKAEETGQAVGKASNIAFVDLTHTKVEKDVLGLLPREMAIRYNAVPIDLKNGNLTVAMTNPEDFDAIQVIRKETGLTIKPVLTSKDDLNLIFDQYTGLQAEVQEVIEAGDFGISKAELTAASAEKVEEVGDDENAPTAKIVTSLLTRAVKERASDIHVEPYEKKVIVRFRIDGVLIPRVELPKAIQGAVVARLKILANLKIDEQRLPQDGRFSITLDKREIDFRVSAIPVVFGETIVMRILDKQAGIRDLEEVGLTGHGFDVLVNNMRRSHGMILVTGPTGSGKTTTLYAVLGRLMKSDVNIVTLEDPVEYRIESINQSQVHVEIGYGFAQGLRSVVRQDPDIVMLGEIRDRETAEMAVQAALTGHVVLSTLHTNDAAGAFPRLIDMGVEPFLITSSIHTVIAQRLARTLDPDYKVERELNSEEKKEVLGIVAEMPESVHRELEKAGVDLKNPKVWEPKAVDGQTGYRGRIGIFEVLDVSEPIRELIQRRVDGDQIKQQAIKEGMLTMTQDGIIKALTGKTSLAEVWRVTRE